MSRISHQGDPRVRCGFGAAVAKSRSRGQSRDPQSNTSMWFPAFDRFFQ